MSNSIYLITRKSTGAVIISEHRRIEYKTMNGAIRAYDRMVSRGYLKETLPYEHGLRPSEFIMIASELVKTPINFEYVQKR